jgi:hypothetical protein
VEVDDGLNVRGHVKLDDGLKVYGQVDVHGTAGAPEARPQPLIDSS